MVKIGIIIDNYHLENKVAEFLKYLKSKAEVSFYLEEDHLLSNDDFKFDEDLFFVKGKGDLMINLAKMIENNTSIKVINSSRAIWLTIHRFLNGIIMKKAGIRIPRFSLNPSDSEEPFEDFIIKNIIDQKIYAFKAHIRKKEGHLKVSDERALSEANGKENYKYFYYQNFIKTKWEYKVYAFGHDLYFYKQLPYLVNPNKMETRKKIEKIPELEEMVLKAMSMMDLKVTSMDFLKSKDGLYYLTDINSLPNFNYIENGPKIIADYLIEQAKK